MSVAPVTLELSARQRALLLQIQKRQTASVRLARRVNILLRLDADPCLEAAAQALRLTRVSVRLWRERWRAAAAEWRAAEAAAASDDDLLRLIEAILDDAPRPGTPATFSPEQIVQIVAVACEPPEKSGRPISHWTSAELADEVKRRHIVKDISPRTVGRFLKRGRPATAPQSLLAQRQSA